MRLVIPFAAALTLCGCATAPAPEPRVITRDVMVPVAVACVPATLRPAPVYPDTDDALRKADPATRYRLTIAGRDLRKARLGELEPVVEGCQRK